MQQVEIRPEIPSEIDDIRDINVAAFRDHPISQQTEHLSYYRRFGFATYPELEYEGVPHEYVSSMAYAELADS